MPVHDPSMPPVVLASGSVFRRALLARLGMDFTWVSPEVDESPRPGETPEAVASRLAESKARHVALDRPDALVIGSDQVAVLQDRMIGKPGGRDSAIEQLLSASGQAVRFLTAVCLLNATTGRMQLDLVPYVVVFRKLDRASVERYVDRERPYGCAGAFKSEGLGIALAERMTGDDPTALIGLPLIRLTGMLAEEGIVVV